MPCIRIELLAFQDCLTAVLSTYLLPDCLVVVLAAVADGSTLVHGSHTTTRDCQATVQTARNTLSGKMKRKCVHAGSSMTRGVAYLHLPCHVGTAQAVARFYAHTLQARVSYDPPSSSSSSGSGRGSSGSSLSSGHVGSVHAGEPRLASAPASGAAPAPACAEVWLGPGVKLRFVEDVSLGAVSEQVSLGGREGEHSRAAFCHVVQIQRVSFCLQAKVFSLTFDHMWC